MSSLVQALADTPSPALLAATSKLVVASLAAWWFSFTLPSFFPYPPTNQHLPVEEYLAHRATLSIHENLGSG